MWSNTLISISIILLFLFMFPLGYLLLLAIGAARTKTKPRTIHRSPSTQFMIVIPAHNESNVIRSTIESLHRLDYPSQLFSIHIVADHCTDETTKAARLAGAIVHERNEGPRTGKGAALSWLFQMILEKEHCDAVIIFDADTRVDPKFLRVMDWRLAQGDQVIQGQHVISNPNQGWFPALIWAMFLIDNRFQNLGRQNLGWSAKNMGDSICFRVDILRQLGWGAGLTDDYQMRQRLLLKGILITYEPAAIGYGEAPQNWGLARPQRARWLRGTRDASQQFVIPLLAEGLKRRNLAMVDGALQGLFPSYSTQSVLSLSVLMILVPINYFIKSASLWVLIGAWAVVVGTLLIYPLVGLALESAPIKAYLAIILGPFFILWRTWLAILAQFGKKRVTWVRTEHGKLK